MLEGERERLKWRLTPLTLFSTSGSQLGCWFSLIYFKKSHGSSHIHLTSTIAIDFLVSTLGFMFVIILSIKFLMAWWMWLHHGQEPHNCKVWPCNLSTTIRLPPRIVSAAGRTYDRTIHWSTGERYLGLTRSDGMITSLGSTVFGLRNGHCRDHKLKGPKEVYLWKYWASCSIKTILLMHILSSWMLIQKIAI